MKVAEAGSLAREKEVGAGVPVPGKEVAATTVKIVGRESKTLVELVLPMYLHSHSAILAIQYIYLFHRPSEYQAIEQ